MYLIVASEAYKKRFRKFIRQHPQIRSRYEKTLRLLAENPYHPSLRLHKLEGCLAIYYSVSLSKEYRLLIDFIIKDQQIILLDIGSHDEVYR